MAFPAPKIKRLVRRLASAVASRVPPTVGPRRWTAFAIRVRTRRAGDLLAADPRAALDLVGPALMADSPARSWMIAALANEMLGNTDTAIDLARKATASHHRDLRSLQEHRKLAVRTSHAADVPEVLAAMAMTRPRNTAELEIALAELRAAPRDLMESFAETVRSHSRTRRLSMELIEEMLDEDTLVAAHEAGPEKFESEKLRVLNTRLNPIAVVTRALMRREAWQELATFVAVTPGSQLIGPQARKPFPVKPVNKAAAKALKAGHPTPAAMLAARVLAAEPSSRAAQETFDAAQDQIRVARHGWAFPPPASEPPYDPDPSAALAVLSQSLPITSGGYATRSHGILSGLAAQGRRIEAVTRLGFPYDRWPVGDSRTVPPIDTVDGIMYHRLVDERRTYPQHPLAAYVNESAAGIERIAKMQRSALIHASSFYVTGMAGLTAARQLGIPFIYEMRGLEELMKVSRDDTFVGSGREAFLRRVETLVAAQADAALIITKALRDEMIERGVDPDRAFVVPNGVHTDRFQPRERDRELEAQLGFADKTVIGYVGGLVDYEGVDLLIEAVALLRSARSDDFRVLIVGDGANERRIRQVTAEHRLMDVVTFTGRVPHSEVNRYLSLVDIAPFPRLPLPVCELISPIKPFESMAMGKAVIASDVAALAEIVEDGRTGRLFAKGDAAHLARLLAELIDDADQRRILGAAARDWVVRERDWQSITSIVNEVYEDVLDRKRAVAGTTAVEAGVGVGTLSRSV